MAEWPYRGQKPWGEALKEYIDGAVEAVSTASTTAVAAVSTASAAAFASKATQTTVETGRLSPGPLAATYATISRGQGMADSSTDGAVQAVRARPLIVSLNGAFANVATAAPRTEMGVGFGIGQHRMRLDLSQFSHARLSVVSRQAGPAGQVMGVDYSVNGGSAFVGSLGLDVALTGGALKTTPWVAIPLAARRSDVVITLMEQGGDGVTVANIGNVIIEFADRTAQPAPLWFGDYETGDMSQFRTGDPENADPTAPVAQQAVVADGAYAGAYTVPSGGKRSESIPRLPRMSHISEGDDLWFAWRTRLATGHPLNIPYFQILTQWKHNGLNGSPPLALTIRAGTSEFYIEGGFSHPDGANLWAVSLGPIVLNTWTTWLWNIKFSTDPAVGHVQVWRDGVGGPNFYPVTGTLYPPRAANGSNPNQNYDSGSYLKTGYYRDTAITTAATVYHDSWRVGTSRGAVELL